MNNNFRLSDLEVWLAKNHMKTKDLAELIGCSRPVIWKVKVGMPIWDKFADRIRMITRGEVDPICKPYGRPRTQ